MILLVLSALLDRDEYFTNQFGHPYQGSIYHAAARSNGFTFYQAALFDIFGSVSWELFFETNAPSINDLISTTLGGAALGEMFHRLYLEIPNPLAVLVSPMDAFNGLVTRRRPQNPQWGDFELKAFIYEVFNIFWNENKDSGADLIKNYYQFCFVLVTDNGIICQRSYRRFPAGHPRIVLCPVICYYAGIGYIP